MHIFTVFVVKNEEDIVRESVAHALRFSDKVFVLDNGSSDRTRDILRSIKDEKFVFLGVINSPFRLGFRAWIWFLLSEIAQPDDWWCFADADEFYVDDVREFLKNIPPYYGVVYKKQIFPVPLRSQREDFLKLSHFDESFFTHYVKSDWAETRFIRHSRFLRLASMHQGTHRYRAIYPELIRVKHFNFRTKNQVELRILTRKMAIGQGGPSFSHVTQTTWEDALYSDSDPNIFAIEKGVYWEDKMINFHPNSLSFKFNNLVRILLYKMHLR